LSYAQEHGGSMNLYLRNFFVSQRRRWWWL